MKNITTILLILLFALSCKAQSPIINIEDRPADKISGAYYKDTNNLLNQFEGTYISNFRGKKLEITLQKKLMNFNTRYYEDMLVGEYKYTKGSMVLIDRLNELNVPYPDQRNHSIDGTSITEYGDYLCQGCVPGEIRFSGGLVENSTDSWAEILISRTTVNGQPAIKLWIGWQLRGYKLDDGPPPPPNVPGGDYIMIKQ